MRPLRHSIGLLAGLALASASANAAWAQARSLEYPVKAAFLYKFGGFVAWPPPAFPAADSPVVLCVVGKDPFGPMLDASVRGQTAGSRPIVVRRLESVSPLSGCHIAFLGGSARQSVAEATKILARTPVLTVTDGAPPGARGAINFVVRANRVRFQIDQRAALQGGLSISSKLLNLAVEVG